MIVHPISSISYEIIKEFVNDNFLKYFGKYSTVRVEITLQFMLGNKMIVSMREM